MTNELKLRYSRTFKVTIAFRFILLCMLCFFVWIAVGLSGCLYGADCRSMSDCKEGWVCSGGLCQQPRGKMFLYALLRSSRQIQKVQVLVDGPLIEYPVWTHLSLQRGAWIGELRGLPAGKRNRFLLRAFNKNKDMIFEKSFPNISILSDSTGWVGFWSHPTKNNTIDLKAPRIRGLWLSDMSVKPSQNIQLRLLLDKGRSSSALQYSWSGTGGSFSHGRYLNATWFAAKDLGFYELHALIRSASGAQAALGFSVKVSKSTKDNESIEVRPNMWPSLVSLYSSKVKLKSGESSILTVKAFDLEGHLLRYVWSDGGCGGSFFPTESAQTKWTSPANSPPSGKCRLVTIVYDGRGGSVTRSLWIEVDGA